MDIQKILNIFFTGQNKHIDDGSKSIIKALTDLKQDIKNSNPSATLSTIGIRLEKTIAKLNNPNIDVTVDLDDLQGELVKSREAIQGLKMPTLEKVERTLEKVLHTISKMQPVDTRKELKALKDALDAIKTYDTVKIDDMQLRSLRGSSGGIQLGGASPQTASNRTLANTALTTANTEYSYTFPANTTSWKIRIRDTDVPLLVGFVTGKLPTSGDGAAYFTVSAYYTEETSGVEWGGKTIYLQTGSATQVAEIISYSL